MPEQEVFCDSWEKGGLGVHKGGVFSNLRPPPISPSWLSAVQKLQFGCDFELKNGSGFQLRQDKHKWWTGLYWRKFMEFLRRSRTAKSFTLQPSLNFYFIPLLSSFELYLLPFLPLILVLIKVGFGFICVNLYCLLSIFLISLLFSCRSNRHINYTAKDKQPQKEVLPYL